MLNRYLSATVLFILGSCSAFASVRPRVTFGDLPPLFTMSAVEKIKEALPKNEYLAYMGRSCRSTHCYGSRKFMAPYHICQYIVNHPETFACNGNEITVKVSPVKPRDFFTMSEVRPVLNALPMNLEERYIMGLSVPKPWKAYPQARAVSDNISQYIRAHSDIFKVDGGNITLKQPISFWKERSFYTFSEISVCPGILPSALQQLYITEREKCGANTAYVPIPPAIFAYLRSNADQFNINSGSYVYPLTNCVNIEKHAQYYDCVNRLAVYYYYIDDNFIYEQIHKLFSDVEAINLISNLFIVITPPIMEALSRYEGGLGAFLERSVTKALDGLVVANPDISLTQIQRVYIFLLGVNDVDVKEFHLPEYCVITCLPEHCVLKL